MKEGKSADCQKSVSIDVDEMNSCTNDSGRGLVYAQKDFDLAGKFKITGSPTMLMNDRIVKESDFATNTTNSRSPEAVKELLCCGFKKEPSFCSLEMNKSSYGHDVLDQIVLFTPIGRKAIFRLRGECGGPSLLSFSRRDLLFDLITDLIEV